MSTLFGKSVASTYKDLLQVSNNNIGVDDVVRYIEDGEGTRSALALSTDTVVLSGHLLPQVNSQVDLGSAELKFRHLFLSDNTIYIGDQTFNTTDIQAIKDIRSSNVTVTELVSLTENSAQKGNIQFEELSTELQNSINSFGDTSDSAVQPGTSPTFENINLTGGINGPEIIKIDPAAVGDNTGKVVIAGDLQVDGDTTTVNSTTISTSSSVITLAQGATDAAQADQAGVVVDGANTAIKYSAASNQWIVDRELNTPSIVSESLSHSSQINLTVANNLLLDLHSDGSDRNMTVFAKTLFNDTLSVGEAVQFGPDGSVGGITPTINGQSIVWDGAKWRPAVASTGDGEATEVPAAYTQALPSGNSIYTINFQKEYTTPPAITTDLQVQGELPIIPYVITDVTTTNFTIEFAEVLPAPGYTIHISFGGRDILWKNGELNSIYYDEGDVQVNNLEISGNLSVAGTTTTINSTELSIRDRNITLADNTLSRDLSGVNGNAGITWGNDNKVKFLYNSDTGFTFEGAQIISPRRYMSDKSLELVSDWTDTGDTSIISFKIDGQGALNEKMRITSEGRVGIGTSSPKSLLHIETQPSSTGIIPSTNADELVLENNSNCGLTIGTENLGSIYFGKAADTSIGQISYSMGDNHMRFATDSTEAMRIDSTGRLGIGTTNPHSTLQVAGDVRVGSNGSYSDIVFETQTKFGIYEGVMGIFPSTVPGSGVAEYATYFKTNVNADATGSTRHDVLIDGRVGIGTTSPDTTLHIKSTAPVIKLTDTNTDLSSLLYADTGMGSLLFIADSTGGGTDPFISFRTQGTGIANEKLRITNNGHVGIGTSSPARALHVVHKGDDISGRDAVFIEKHFKSVEPNVTQTGYEKGVYVDGRYSDIPVDSREEGYRIAVDASCYISDTNFKGYLEQNYGIWARAGAYTNSSDLANQSPTGTINRSYAVYADCLQSDDVTINHSYGIYQNASYANADDSKNYFASRVGIGTSEPESKLHIYASGSSVNPSTLLTLENYSSDLHQNSSFISFKFTDDNENEDPQVQIGAEVGQNVGAGSSTAEGAGAFVVKTNYPTSTGDATAGLQFNDAQKLEERLRVDYRGVTTIKRYDVIDTNDASQRTQMRPVLQLITSNNDSSGASVVYKGHGGSIDFYTPTYQNNTPTPTARIAAQIDSNASSTYGGRLSFWCTRDQDSDYEERARLDHAGRWNIWSESSVAQIIHNENVASTNHYFLRGYANATLHDNANATTGFEIFTNGDMRNANGVYGTLTSDARVKENVVDATGKLQDLLSLNVKN